MFNEYPPVANYTLLAADGKDGKDLMYGVSQRANDDQLNDRNQWLTEKVFPIPNNKLDGVAKMVVFGISQEFVRRNIKHSQLTKVWYPNVSDQCGVPPQTVGERVTQLVRVKALESVFKWEKDKMGEKKRRTYIAFTPMFLTDPASLFITEKESNHGGSRVKRHKGCGGLIVNTCTSCGESHIPDSETYIEKFAQDDDAPTSEQGPVDKNGQPLPPMNEIEHWYDHGTDAAELPDDVVEAMGGAEEALHAKPLDIRTRMNMPRHQRAGIDDDDMAAADAAMAEMMSHPKYAPMEAGTPVIQKGKHGRKSNA